jgi:PPOX class probable F420-dependent enzyme
MRLSEQESRRLLAASRSAVLALNDAGGSPLAVPITFALLSIGEGDDVLVFAVDHKPKSGAPLRRLRLIAADPRVAVLADGYDDDWRQLWWVRADGSAEVLPAGTSDPLRERALAALLAKYLQYRERPPRDEVVVIRVDRLSGWSGADLGTPTAVPRHDEGDDDREM